MVGSPPRVRGKLLDLEGTDELARITPACAGKTMKNGLESNYEQDHPRVCGENRGFIKLGTDKIGSPPRVRGKHTMRIEPNELYRITPACAGKTDIA